MVGWAIKSKNPSIRRRNEFGRQTSGNQSRLSENRDDKIPAATAGTEHSGNSYTGGKMDTETTFTESELEVEVLKQKIEFEREKREIENFFRGEIIKHQRCIVILLVITGQAFVEYFRWFIQQ